MRAALNILGLPGNRLRPAYMDPLDHPYDELKAIMYEMGVIEKYGV